MEEDRSRCTRMQAELIRRLIVDWRRDGRGELECSMPAKVTIADLLLHYETNSH